MVVMKAAAIVLCLIAAGAMIVAIWEMIAGTGGGRRGYVLRGIALVAFGLAVLFNVLR
jgi:hypothetical protein